MLLKEIAAVAQCTLLSFMFGTASLFFFVVNRETTATFPTHT
jgi:hypothetical protein